MVPFPNGGWGGDTGGSLPTDTAPVSCKGVTGFFKGGSQRQSMKCKDAGPASSVLSDGCLSDCLLCGRLLHGPGEQKREKVSVKSDSVFKALRALLCMLRCIH